MTGAIVRSGRLWWIVVGLWLAIVAAVAIGGLGLVLGVPVVLVALAAASWPIRRGVAVGLLVLAVVAFGGLAGLAVEGEGTSDPTPPQQRQVR